MNAPEYVLFSSCGNDSIALIKYMIDNNINDDVVVVYHDTGWAVDWWGERVEQCKKYIEANGMKFVVLESIGMEELVRKKQMFPANGLQFCTKELKIVPAIKYLYQIDPHKESICVTGIRREESPRRSQWAEWIENSKMHDERSLWSPLVRVRETERNEMINKAGFEVLQHRSMECFPCVNANQKDILMIDDKRISEIEEIEDSMSITKNGHKRTMFRPSRFGGNIGIRNVVGYIKGMDKHKQLDMFDNKCDSGFCGG